MDGQAVVNEEIRRQIMDHMGKLEVAFRELDPEGKGEFCSTFNLPMGRSHAVSLAPLGYISHLDFRKALYVHCGLPYSAVGVLMGASLAPVPFLILTSQLTLLTVQRLKN